MCNRPPTGIARLINRSEKGRAAVEGEDGRGGGGGRGDGAVACVAIGVQRASHADAWSVALFRLSDDSFPRGRFHGSTDREFNQPADRPIDRSTDRPV